MHPCTCSFQWISPHSLGCSPSRNQHSSTAEIAKRGSPADAASLLASYLRHSRGRGWLVDGRGRGGWRHGMGGGRRSRRLVHLQWWRGTQWGDGCWPVDSQLHAQAAGLPTAAGLQLGLHHAYTTPCCRAHPKPAVLPTKDKRQRTGGRGTAIGHPSTLPPPHLWGSRRWRRRLEHPGRWGGGCRGEDRGGGGLLRRRVGGRRGLLRGVGGGRRRGLLVHGRSKPAPGLGGVRGGVNKGFS